MNNQTNVTITGYVATEPRLREVPNGAKVTNFRLASTERRFDKGLKQWRDGATMFVTVACWRSLAENVLSSVKKGQPVVVEGRLHVSSYDDKDGVARNNIEIEAAVVGHDLTRGISAFTKADPAMRTEREIVPEAQDLEREDSPGFDPMTGEILDDSDPGASDSHQDGQERREMSSLGVAVRSA